MASPQIENGYTRIANEILEALIRSGLSGNQFAVAMLVVRDSYGWSRKATGPMGLRVISRRTGIARSSVQLAIKWLRTCGIIHQEKNGGWGFNKDYEKWVVGQPTVPGGASPLALKGPAHRTGGASPLAKRGQPTGPVKPILSTREPDPKERKKELKKERKTSAPSAVDLIRGIDKSVKTYLANDFTDYQIKYIGGYRGRRVIDIPASDCRYLLENARPGADRDALLWRISLKKSEGI